MGVTPGSTNYRGVTPIGAINRGATPRRRHYRKPTFLPLSPGEARGYTSHPGRYSRVRKALAAGRLVIFIAALS